jgi:hypothetical protein
VTIFTFFGQIEFDQTRFARAQTLIIFKSILVFLYLNGKATDGYQGKRLHQYSQIPRRIQTNEDGFSGIVVIGWGGVYPN